MNAEIALLAGTGAAIALVHTAAGPDHYIPFVAIGRERGWSLRRTLTVAGACGVAHVGGSVLLGALGLFLGWAISDVTWFDGLRGGFAGWLLLGIGVAYFAWGVRQALRNRPHHHVHRHLDGTVHGHSHTHHDEHLHAPTEVDGGRTGIKGMVPWLLFWVFVLGPSEPLVPLLMYPAAQSSWAAVALVIFVYGACTLLTMLGIVAFGWSGLAHLPALRVGRYSHALAGLALLSCGLAIQLGL